jgi:hypothetical protein
MHQEQKSYYIAVKGKSSIFVNELLERMLQAEGFDTFREAGGTITPAYRSLDIDLGQLPNEEVGRSIRALFSPEVLEELESHKQEFQWIICGIFENHRIPERASRLLNAFKKTCKYIAPLGNIKVGWAGSNTALVYVLDLNNRPSPHPYRKVHIAASYDATATEFADAVTTLVAALTA